MYNILVVDDDKEIVKAIEIYLGKENYNIHKAYDGEQALKQINENEIHLVILDIMMPNKDGLETLEEIRKAKNIPVIMLSAKSEDIDKINGLNIGADDYVTKPFNPVELIARVNALIRRYTKLGAIEEKQGIIRNGELLIDDELKKVIVDGRTTFSIVVRFSKPCDIILVTFLPLYVSGKTITISSRTLPVILLYLISYKA